MLVSKLDDQIVIQGSNFNRQLILFMFEKPEDGNKVLEMISDGFKVAGGWPYKEGHVLLLEKVSQAKIQPSKDLYKPKIETK